MEKRKVSFRRIRGRIVPITHKYPGDDTDYILNQKAPRLTLEQRKGKYGIFAKGNYIKGSRKRLRTNVSVMTQRVRESTAGSRHFTGYGADRKVIGVPSTFPKYFREAGFKKKKEWLSAAKRKKGKNYHKIVNAAFEDLKENDPVIGVRGKQVFYKEVKFITMKVNGERRVVPIRQDDTSFNFGANKASGF